MVGGNSTLGHMWSGYSYYDVMKDYSYADMMSNDRLSFLRAMHSNQDLDGVLLDPWAINADNDENWGGRDAWKGNPHVEWERHIQRRLYTREATCRCPRRSYRCNNLCNVLTPAVSPLTA